MSPKPEVTLQATRKEKGKAIMTEEVTTGRDQVPSAENRVGIPLEKPGEVLAVSSDTVKDPVVLEKIAERVVGDIVGETVAPQKVASPRTFTREVILETSKNPLAEEIQSGRFNVVDVLCGQAISLLRYVNNKREKYAGTTNNKSYVELVRNSTRAKVAATSAAAAKERQL